MLITCSKIPFTQPISNRAVQVKTTKPTMTDMVPLVDRTEGSMASKYALLSYGRKSIHVYAVVPLIATYMHGTLEFQPKLKNTLTKPKEVYGVRKQIRERNVILWRLGAWFANQNKNAASGF
jgi:hypothetical protein